MKVLPRGWKVSFEIKPLGIIKRWSNIIHATIGGNFGKHGDRIPGIWFQRSSTKFIVCSALNENSNYCRRINSPLPLNQYSKVIVQQVQSLPDYQYYYQVYINGKKVLNVVNKNPKVFNNVKYYASDPWYTPGNALIRKFSLVTYKHIGKYTATTLLKMRYSIYQLACIKQ